MRRCIIKMFILCFLLLGYKDHLIAQNILQSKIDTLRFKSIGRIVDTFYSTREKIKGNLFKQVMYYGFSDNTDLGTITDTFLIDKFAWGKVYMNDTLPFLSVYDFAANKKTHEYMDRENKNYFYFEYEPVKIFRMRKKNFYLYKVTPMSGNGKVESVGKNIHYIVFDFSIGEIYVSSTYITKVLEGYEKYVKYFKW